MRQPAVLFVVPGYGYGSKPIDRRDEVAALRAGLNEALCGFVR